MTGSQNSVSSKGPNWQVLKFENADGETLAQEVVDYIDSPERDWQPAFFPLVKKAGFPEESMKRIEKAKSMNILKFSSNQRQSAFGWGKSFGDPIAGRK